MLSEFKTQLEGLDTFTAPEIESLVKKFIEQKETGMGQLMNPLRLSLVGTSKGPGVMEMMEVMGREESLARIEKALETIKK